MNRKLMNELTFINTIDPKRSSVSLDRSGTLVEEKKRSGLRNFFSWVIHIITLTLVPRNKGLDEVTRHILNETKDSSSLPDQDKIILAQAMTKLQAIIKENGGSEGKKVSALLKTLSKVDNLDAVKDLKNTSSPHAIPQPVPSSDRRLQNFLNNEIKREARGADSQQALSELLLQLEGSVDLTQNQRYMLNTALNKIPSQWIQTHLQKISPSLLRFLGENCLKGAEYSSFFENCFLHLMKEPVDSVRLRALIEGFPVFEHEKDHSFIPQGTYLGFKKLLDNLTSENVQCLEKHLDTPHLDHFINSFFGFTGKSVSILESSRYDTILNFAKNFTAPHQSKIWPQLYKGQKEASFLAKIVATSPKEDQVFEKLLAQEKINEALVRNVLLYIKLDQHLEKIAPSVFSRGAQDLKTMLFKGMSPSDILAHLEVIPEEFLKQLDAFKLNLIAKEMQLHISSTSVSTMKKLGTLIESQRNALESVYSCPALMHHLTPVNQAMLLKNRLQKDPSQVWDKKQFFDEAKKLDMSVWQQAGVNLIKKMSTHEIKALAERIKGLPIELEYVATLLNQTDEGLFIQEFLSLDIFRFLESVRLQFINFSNISVEQWKSLLEKMDLSNENAKDCFRVAAKKVLTSTHIDPSYFYALSETHLKALNIEDYKLAPVIQIALVCALDQFQDIAVKDQLDQAVKQIVGRNYDECRYLINFLIYNSNPPEERLVKFTNWLVDHTEKEQNLNFLSYNELYSFILIPLTLKDFYKSKLTYSDQLVHKFIKSLSTKVLISVVREFSSHQFRFPILYQLIETLPAAEANLFLSDQWERIKEDAYDMSKSQTPHALLTSILNDPQKLRELLTGPFHGNYLNQIVNREGYLGPIFEQLEKTPWKLQLILDADSYSPALNRWIFNNKGKYPTCERIIQEYETQKWTDAQTKTLGAQLNELFSLIEDDQYQKALEIYKDLPENTKEYLLKNTRETQGEALFTDLGRLNKGLLWIAVLDETSRKNIQEALKQSIEQLSISDDKNDPRWTNLRDVIQFVEKLANTSDFKGIAQGFLEPFAYVNTHVIFTSLYNNPQFSDVTLKLGHETFNGHRLILSTIPELQSYLNDSDSITVPENQVEKVKNLLLQAYHVYPYTPLHQFLEGSHNKSLTHLFPLDSSQKPEFAPPDFTFKSSSKGQPEILLAHKIVLYCSDLKYFKTLLSFDFNEARTNELIIPEVVFKEFKQLIADTYAGTQRDFEIGSSPNESDPSNDAINKPADDQNDRFDWGQYYQLQQYYRAENDRSFQTEEQKIK